MTSALPTDALELSRLLTPRLNKYIPWEPTPTQAAFLLLDCREAMYGGAAGGGKSVALLAAALQYVDVPGYHALILRRTFAALELPEALIPLAHEWLQHTDAHWHESKHRWTFPSGATLTFGHLETELDKHKYQGAAFAFVAWDELTQFTASQYKYLFSRRRRNKTLEAKGVPMRTRSASNPGGEGHEWVKQRFLTEGAAKGRVFIPAKLADNPHLDVAEYRESLAELPLIERLQLEHGNWEAAKAGDWFKREWWQYIDAKDLPPMRRRLRYWDTASTKPSVRNKDPDFYSGTLESEFRGRFYIEDRVSFREGPAETERRLEQTRDFDGPGVEVVMAQEPGSQSELLIDNYARGIFKGYNFRGDRQTGSKLERAKPFSAACSNGLVFIVRGPWNREFTDQHEAFPTPGVHDDDVDSASGAHQKLNFSGGKGKGALAPAPDGVATSAGM